MSARCVFVTGTDTGVGKTTVTGLLTAHLDQLGANFRALKPFCSGERTDAVLLYELQHGRVPLEQINPFYFEEPLSPWTAARRAGKSITLEQTLTYLCKQAGTCDLLLIEGAGGLLSPLGEGFNAADLIAGLDAEVILVAANRLGVLNHTLLTLEAMEKRGLRRGIVVLADIDNQSAVCKTNLEDLGSLLDEKIVTQIPFLEGFRPDAKVVRQRYLEVATTVVAWARALSLPVLQATHDREVTI